MHSITSAQRGSAARSVRVAALALATAALALMAVLTASARADFGVQPGSFSSDILDAGASPFTQAGGHPDAITTTFSVNTKVDGNGWTVPDGDVKDIVVDMPPGFVGDPNATPKCSQAAFARGGACPADTQVGTDTLTVANPFVGVPMTLPLPVYNLEPSFGHTADFGFVFGSNGIHLISSVRSDGDYGLRMTITNISSAYAFFSSSLTFWGVPADHNGGGGERRPFLTMPTRCDAPLRTTLSIDAWEDPGVFRSATVDAATPTGCEKLTFAPSISVQPDTTQADSPSGYRIAISVPQDDDPGDVATPTLDSARVTLPAGTSLSPSVADGLQGCSDAQVGLHALADPACPDASKIGTVEIRTPLLSDPLEGSIYLGAPVAGDPYRLFLVASGSGMTIKLAGSIVPDPQSGQLVATFDHDPQLPFSDLVLQLDGGPRAALANGPACGPATTTGTMTSAAGQTATVSDSFVVSLDGRGAACPASLPFAPSFLAGSASSAAGASTPFTLAFSRGDREQGLQSLTATLPAGLLAKVGNVPLCSDAQVAARTCPASSRIGTAMVGTGAGADPLTLRGTVYLTGPYRGAPFGLAIVVPAVAGPYDLGTVVVRAAIDVDRSTAALRITSDPLPTILQGIPLRIRSVRVGIDRGHFMVNPTRCVATRVRGAIAGSGGAVANVASRFQVGGCASLRYTPRMTITAGRKGHTSGGVSTPLTVVLSQPHGQANNRAIGVTLPSTLAARVSEVAKACTQAQYLAGRCGDAARVGSGSAVTPLLARPLAGPAYFVKLPHHQLPSIVVKLRGQLAIDLAGTVSVSTSGQLRTTFATVPDVPITTFTLRLRDGAHAPLAVRDGTSLCRGAGAASVVARGQNGARVALRPTVKVAGCPRPAHAR